ncbi:MAG: hypothetical protein RSC08_02680 [Oscillospiraceae bacterium]
MIPLDIFLKFAHELIWAILRNIGDFFVTIGKSLLGIFTSFAQYATIVRAYMSTFEPLQIALAVILLLVLIAIVVLLLYKVFLAARRHFKRRSAHINEDDLMSEIAALNNQVADLVDEKSKILAMKVSQLGLNPGEDNEVSDGSGEQSAGTRAGDPSRFPKLTQVDTLYAEKAEHDWDNEITLPELMERYRNFACSRMKLYYSLQTVRLFFSGMAASKIIILEGISGTGKTSLPYSVSRFFQNPAGMVSVQPSFRDRTELFGYFNEFTKRFNETEFLRFLYTASYREDPNFIVLDEMNLARIEYYFAEMLSVLEMPDPSEWTVDLVPVAWASDPKLLSDGKLLVPTNLWFVGTANNDDSTFTITDKVYDRALSIDLNERADPFVAPDTPPIDLACGHLQELFRKAKEDNPIGAPIMEKLAKLDQHLQLHFKLAIGNRILKQLQDFVPVFVACGGTENEAIDYIIQRKILKKFESLNITFVRDELRELVNYIDKIFGKTGLPESKKYLVRLQNMF